MSLLIMSIGLTAVISIFPVAILRSIQATQLTNARMMSHNAREILKQQFRDTSTGIPYDILSQSTISGPDNTAKFRGTWQPGTVYYPDNIVVASRPQGGTHPVPNLWFVCVDPTDPAGAVSGVVEPNWEAGTSHLTRVVENEGSGNPVVWAPWFDPDGVNNPPVIRHNAPVGGVAFYSALNYIVDPLGWWMYYDDATNLLDDGSPSDFGYKVAGVGGLGTRPGISSASNPFLLRSNGGAVDLAAARDLVTHPDSWSVAFSGVPVSWTFHATLTDQAVSATFPSTADFSTIDTSGSYRIVLTSSDSPGGIVRPIGTVNAGTRTIEWAEPLPMGFVPDGTARIEVFEQRYTWLATVNKDLRGNAKVTVAVMFKRGFKPAEEHMYDANFGNDGVAPYTAPGATWAVSVRDQIRIHWSATEPEPLLKAGNWVLDGKYAKWYRIVAVQRMADYDAILTVDRSVPLADGTASPETVPGRAILMRGIVELFEL